MSVWENLLLEHTAGCHSEALTYTSHRDMQTAEAQGNPFSHGAPTAAKVLGLKAVTVKYVFPFLFNRERK